MDQNNDQSVGDDVVDSQVVVKQEELVLNQHVHEQQQQQSIDHQPEKQQAQREPSQQQSKQSVAVQTTMSTDMMDDFELSSEAIGLAPPLDVDELDRLLRGDFD